MLYNVKNGKELTNRILDITAMESVNMVKIAKNAMGGTNWNFILKIIRNKNAASE